MGLQFYFLAMNCYGWYFWSKHKKSEDKTGNVMTKKEILLSIAGIIVFTFRPWLSAS